MTRPPAIVMESYRERGRALLLMLGVASLLGAALIIYQFVNQTAGRADPHDRAQVARGQDVYEAHCAVCHGKELEGQPDWRIRMANGRLPAPPHDGGGHTWHHPDAALFGITRQGLVPPYAPENYQSDMPAFAGTLTDEDIWSVLAFIKSRWPEEMRKFQQDANGRAHEQSR